MRLLTLSMAVVCATTACVGGESGRSVGISLQRPVESSAVASFPFTAKFDGRHAVSLEFAWPISDPRVEKTVVDAMTVHGPNGSPRFDFSWQLSNTDRVVAHGDTPLQAVGVSDMMLSWLGPFRRTALGLVFGYFDLKAGNEYVIRIVPGPGFGAIATSRPQIVVERRPSLFNEEPK